MTGDCVELPGVNTGAFGLNTGALFRNLVLSLLFKEEEEEDDDDVVVDSVFSSEPVDVVWALFRSLTVIFFASTAFSPDDFSSDTAKALIFFSTSLSATSASFFFSLVFSALLFVRTSSEASLFSFPPDAVFASSALCRFSHAFARDFSCCRGFDCEGTFSGSFSCFVATVALFPFSDCLRGGSAIGFALGEDGGVHTQSDDTNFGERFQSVMSLFCV